MGLTGEGQPSAYRDCVFLIVERCSISSCYALKNGWTEGQRVFIIFQWYFIFRTKLGYYARNCMFISDHYILNVPNNISTNISKISQSFAFILFFCLPTSELE